MQIMRPAQRTTTHTDAGDIVDLCVIVESDEDEKLEFHAGSAEEMEAKLEDFMVWAS